MAIRAGQLNKRVTVQAPTRASDSRGGFTETWTDLDTIWAAIWPASAKESMLSDKETMVATHRIRIRYRSAFSNRWRIKFGNRYFAIQSIINPSEQNEALDLLCTETSK